MAEFLFSNRLCKNRRPVDRGGRADHLCLDDALHPRLFPSLVLLLRTAPDRAPSIRIDTVNVALVIHVHRRGVVLKQSL